MTGNAASFHQNFVSDKKTNDTVEKDIRKWVESVVEFKANLDKQKGEQQLEKHLKKIKKFKIKKKPSLVAVTTKNSKKPASGQQKNTKTKKLVKKVPRQPSAEKVVKKEPSASDAFDSIKECYRNVKLPQNWTSGLSGNRVVFNRIKVTTQNAQQKMAVERSLVITKDRNVHVLINGSEIVLNNWEMQKVDTADDMRRAIKDIDSLKVCDGGAGGAKSPQCTTLIDSKHKMCAACKSETSSPQKNATKKLRTTKKAGEKKEFQNKSNFKLEKKILLGKTN